MGNDPLRRGRLPLRGRPSVSSEGPSAVSGEQSAASGQRSAESAKTSVYPAAIEPAKPTRMKEIDFSGWPQRLTQAPLPDREKQSFAVTLRWYLSFCRRSRGGVNVQSARDFTAWAQQTKRPEPWKLERWREAIGWFFREAQAAGATRDHPASKPSQGPSASTSHLWPEMVRSQSLRSGSSSLRFFEFFAAHFGFHIWPSLRSAHLSDQARRGSELGSPSPQPSPPGEGVRHPARAQGDAFPGDCPTPRRRPGTAGGSSGVPGNPLTPGDRVGKHGWGTSPRSSFVLNSAA